MIRKIYTRLTPEQRKRYAAALVAAAVLLAMLPFYIARFVELWEIYA